MAHPRSYYDIKAIESRADQQYAESIVKEIMHQARYDEQKMDRELDTFTTLWCQGHQDQIDISHLSRRH
jgi:hypothetical protein